MYRSLGIIAIHESRAKGTHERRFPRAARHFMLSDLDMKKPLNESMICEEHVTPPGSPKDLKTEGMPRSESTRTQVSKIVLFTIER